MWPSILVMTTNSREAVREPPNEDRHKCSSISDTQGLMCPPSFFLLPLPVNRYQLLVRFCKEPNTITLNLQGSFILGEFRTSIKTKGFPGGSDGKESACNAVDPGSIPGLGRFPWRRHGNPTQYSCLRNPMGQRFMGSQGVEYAWAPSIKTIHTQVDSVHKQN